MQKLILAVSLSLVATSASAFITDGKYDTAEGWQTGFEVSYISNGNTYAGGFLAFGEDAGGQYLYIAAPKSFVDNSYGDNAIGWPGDNHTFKHLKGSDALTFTADTNYGEMSIKVDYIGETSKNSDVYRSGGIGKNNTPGNDVTRNNDGAFLSGSQQAENSIVEIVTSLEYNLNQYQNNNLGLDVTSDSPDADANYENVQAGFEDWIYEVGYEIAFAPGTFDSNYWLSADVNDINSLLSDFHVHASPSKSGENDPDYVMVSVCGPNSTIPACGGGGGGGGGNEVPVPAPLSLALLGAAALGWQRRRQQARSVSSEEHKSS